MVRGVAVEISLKSGLVVVFGVKLSVCEQGNMFASRLSREVMDDTDAVADFFKAEEAAEFDEKVKQAIEVVWRNNLKANAEKEEAAAIAAAEKAENSKKRASLSAPEATLKSVRVAKAAKIKAENYAAATIFNAKKAKIDEADAVVKAANAVKAGLAKAKENEDAKAVESKAKAKDIKPTQEASPTRRPTSST